MGPDARLSIRARIIADPVIAPLLSSYRGDPAVFTHTTIPNDAQYPLIVVSPNVNQTNEDGVDDQRPVIANRIFVHGLNNSFPQQYRDASTIAFRVRTLFHRQRNVTIPEWPVIDQRCLGPLDQPSVGQITTRIVTLTSRLSFFSPLFLTPWVWYDPSDLTTLFQDAAMTLPVTINGQRVGAILDKGEAGAHAVQAVADKRPIYRTSGGLHWLESTSDEHTLRTNSVGIAAMPFEWLAAGRFNAVASGRNHVMAGSGNNQALVFTNNGAASPISLNVGWGQGERSAGQVEVGEDFVVNFRANGANSRAAVDKREYETFNVGPTGLAAIELLGRDLGDSQTRARFVGFIGFNRTVTDRDTDLLRTFLAGKQGRLLQ